jgi:hypothetical protein
MKNFALYSLHLSRPLSFLSALVACLVVIGFLSPVEAKVVKPKITSTLNTTGTVLVAFTYQITASNSPTSYSSTSLPAGLGIDSSTGAITGYPLTAGESTATIRATNSKGTGSATLTFTISASSVPVITSLLTASGTTGASFSYQITASNSPTKYAATPLPAGLKINTTTGAITGTPNTAATTSVTISATNAQGTGNATLVVTIGSTAGITAPAQAVAAGFSHLVFDDEFTSANTIASSESPTSGFNWYWNPWYGNSKDYTAGSGATAGATGILSINGPMELQSVPTNAPVTQRVGTWQHAYFEARLQFSYTVSGQGDPNGGWPSFWTYAIQAEAPTVGEQIAELDFLEAYPLGTAGAQAYVVNTIHNWQATKTTATGKDTANTENNNYQQSLQGTTEPAQPTDNAWHTYGCLWTGNGTSGTVQFYYDNHLILHQASVTTFPVGTGTGFPALEQDNMFMILQGVSGWPINVDWVRVWQ